jgi:hypothetical protein
LGLPAAYVALDHFGPGSRVTFTPYLFDESAGKFLIGCFLGLLLGADAYRVLRPSAPPYSVSRLAIAVTSGCVFGIVGALALLAISRGKQGSEALLLVALAVGALAGWGAGVFALRAGAPATAAEPQQRRMWIRVSPFLLWLGWCLTPHLQAFPSNGNMGERAAWARRHVREYVGLTEVVAALPQVTQDVGRIVQIAPTAHDRHAVIQDMSGDYLKFSLEVRGEKGTGVFRSNCALSQGHLQVWETGHWLFHGKDTPILSVPGHQPAPH